MDIRQLRYFMAIVEEGQISRAAKKLHIAQPPLSLQLKLLEQELDVQLIERNTKTFRVTEAGRVLYQRAEQILGLVKATRREVQEYDGGLRGTLAIGSPPGVGHLYLPGRIDEFHARYPEVNFQWREGNTYRVLELLHSRVIEIGVVRLPVDDAIFDSIALLTEPWVAVAKKAPGGRPAKTISLARLLGQPLLMMHSQQGTFCHERVLEELRKAQGRANVFCESDNVMALLTLVKLGLGTAVVPQSTTTLMPDPEFQIMQIASPNLESSVALVWLRRNELSAAARLFLGMCGAPQPKKKKPA